ncbi:essential MCU regulator, mitochondrial [Echeneis naucrates]|uniref:essential MCU regulator, mitochondrial n=1 Tax=Echeneis naucrates TaxID=173247 RepID=UPI001113BCDA|nr:essential MCU regulator, mitochondrial [Echeneis naucrates]XP_029364219.1 essential MCU regulator, mitochondrial [Echeneis naucrates]
MVSVLGRLAGLSALRHGPGRAVTPRRTAVCSPSGAVLPKPKKTPFGLVRIALVVMPFLYVGTQISKNFAALLEEHDIFVPEDDDDDD